MPVYSMTGFASAQSSAVGPESEPDGKEFAPGRLGMEVRSVNSRYLDLTFRLPEEFRAYEPALRELVIGRIRRGKVEMRAVLESGSQPVLAEPTARMLQRLGAIQDMVRAWLPEVRALSVAEIIGFCGGQRVPQRDWREELLALAEQTVNALRSAREREGERLAAMLLAHIGQLRALATQAGPLVPQLVAQQRQRFLDRWQQAMALTDADASVMPQAAQDRALTEATAFAMRIDVAEEITRLHSHLDEIERLIHKGGELGKRLDFLIQELHREANTLGSKSAALELTHISVDMKVLIEQMREQVQNLE